MVKKRALLMVRSDTRPEIETGWNNWYHTEHIPSRLNIPGFLSGRRSVAVKGEPKYLSVYDLTSIDVPSGCPGAHPRFGPQGTRDGMRLLPYARTRLLRDLPRRGRETDL